ncbi:MAG: bifunctional UDP-N-acetylmuramoyl-tripeptide:D-alanyl-D-alanine ligase/alanine racemase [Bacteroidetes bacterium]|nr:bifunctional UDP-N-acetylmuramoyl-tripeptide:D-alanyl-D-alanine ligase/alanine racemase [Bacteroidota bacterium]
MNNLTASELCRITGGEIFGDKDLIIRNLLTDSRSLALTTDTAFFALTGERHDGHKYISELYEKGVRCFVVSRLPELTGKYGEACFISVRDTINALQKAAAFRRGLFRNPVIGITGSNGKTIVKEWLFSLTEDEKVIVRSPKSYNSQVGVPLSVWQLHQNADYAIFEAGISKPGEMQRLQPIIDPTIGIFTNIGQAHQENFGDLRQKAREKLELFKDCRKLIYCKDYKEIEEEISGNAAFWKDRLFTWSRKSSADLQITSVHKTDDAAYITALYNNKKTEIEIPFENEAAIENAVHCWATLLLLGYDRQIIRQKMRELPVVAMRLELKEGINNCSVINDSYNSDLGSLDIALDFLNHQKQHRKKTLVLSDILQTGRQEEDLYKEVADLVNIKNVSRFYGIGEAISKYAGLFTMGKLFFSDTEEFLVKFSPQLFSDEAILLKGARMFNFEKISALLQQKSHTTVLEIRLDAIIHNLNYFRSLLAPGTRIMVMVKAFSYGSGIVEIANLMQFQRVDYLAVAFTDEGVELRKSGITLPIVVLAPGDESLDTIIEYDLEPEIYSFGNLERFIASAKKHGYRAYPVHIEVDTGMRRLGFEESDCDKLADRLRNEKTVMVSSVFSHLAASEAEEYNDFSLGQIKRYERFCDRFSGRLGYNFLRHILNSAGIERFPEARFDMVRLGIGLYGISTCNQDKLMNISTLKTTIVQIKHIRSSETVGYGRSGFAGKDSVIAVLPVGYADGLNRGLSNGVGNVMVNGHRAPFIGNICMDMCMIDVTGTDAKEGDEVIIFGDDYPVTVIADQLGTIPYEVFTGISRRVKRVYFHE